MSSFRHCKCPQSWGRASISAQAMVGIGPLPPDANTKYSPAQKGMHCKHLDLSCWASVAVSPSRETRRDLMISSRSALPCDSEVMFLSALSWDACSTDTLRRSMFAFTQQTGGLSSRSLHSVAAAPRAHQCYKAGVSVDTDSFTLATGHWLLLSATGQAPGYTMQWGPSLLAGWEATHRLWYTGYKDEAKAVQTCVPGPQLRELVLQGRELPVGGARRWRGGCGPWTPAQAAQSDACPAAGLGTPG